ncbi:BCSC C-terminal domain-containing protein [Vibrio sp. ZSDZ34]|uniref:BCSC C-terminal domain-containing protein n=1 Tax=Vibrio gelatinilyticus TaxID=2893468 RepID=A0A9X2AVV1_9VIBR|nr:cellulose synthase subunit BcsC-related outer membrane protein [Vibrio gelatinilyticus]MCJ2376526.1 BCSC C-terminal domain-containing protein [Vibrio gelatinilyticus]
MPVIKWNKRALLLSVMSSILVISFQSIAYDDAPIYVSAESWFDTQIVIGELKKDETLVLSAIERWLAIDPTSAHAKAALGRLSIRNNDNEEVDEIIAELTASGNAREAKKLSLYRAIRTSKIEQYNQVRLLHLGGQSQKALNLYSKLFDNVLPSIEYQLEYLKLKSAISELQSETLNEYRQLDRQYPNVAYIRIELAKHLGRYGNTEEAIDIYKSLSNDRDFGVYASTSWLNELFSSPMSDDWLATFKSVADQHPENLGIQQQYETAKRNWEREKTLRKDPLYRQKLRVFEGIRAGVYTDSGYLTLKRANKKWRDDPEILTAMSRYEYQYKNYNESLALLYQAQKLDDNPDLDSYYSSLIRSVEFWQLLDKARFYQSNQQYKQASTAAKAAINIDPSIALSYVILGQNELSRGLKAVAHRYAKQAIELEPLNRSAILVWVDSHPSNVSNQSLLAAMNLLNSEQKKVIKVELNRLRHQVVIDTLTSKSRLSEQSLQNNSSKNQLLRVVVASNDDFPWLKKELAEQFQRLNLPLIGDDIMARSYQEHPTGETLHAYLLYLSGLKRWSEAYSLLPDTYSNDVLSSSEIATYGRVELGYHKQHIDSKSMSKNELSSYITQVENRNRAVAIVLWEEYGFSKEAKALIESVKPRLLTTSELSAFSIVAYELNEANLHHGIYEEAQRRQSVSIEMEGQHRLFLAENNMAEGRIGSAGDIYLDLLSRSYTVPHDNLLELVDKEPAYAAQILDTMSARINEASDQEFVSALLLAIDTKQQEYINIYNNHLLMRPNLTSFDYWLLQDQAKESDDIGLVKQYAERSLLLDDKERNALSSTRSLQQAYRNADDHWMTNSLVSTLDSLRDRQQSHFLVGSEFNNVPGGSKYLTIPVELKLAMPDYDGHLTLRADTVYLDGGNQTYYGTDDEIPQTRLGQAFSVGWEAYNWKVDLGTTPVGFVYTDWVGGVEGTVEFGDISMRGNISKRPLTSSLVSYSGVEHYSESDQSIDFGGVMKTGGTVSASWNDGRPFGVWGYLEHHLLEGTNVEDNTRTSFMTGSYYNFVSNNDESFSVGGSLFYMGYEKNLSEVVIGHGNYYSPQSYYSITAPVTYFKRMDYDWTVGVRGTLSFSSAKLDAPYLINGANSSQTRGFSSGLQAYTEYNLNEHWTVVGYLSQQFSSEYKPSVLSVFLKYNFDANWQRARLQPDPLRLYSDYY